MAFTLVRGRTPTDPAALSALELEQLRLTGRHFDGRDRPGALRLVDQPIPPEDLEEDIDWDDGNLAAHLLSAWEVHEDGVHRFDVWLHHADSGTLFVAGTTEVVAGRCQSQWMTPGLAGPWPHAEPLDAAMHAVGAW